MDGPLAAKGAGVNRTQVYERKKQIDLELVGKTAAQDPHAEEQQRRQFSALPFGSSRSSAHESGYYSDGCIRFLLDLPRFYKKILSRRRKCHTKRSDPGGEKTGQPHIQGIMVGHARNPLRQAKISNVEDFTNGKEALKAPACI